ncbi:transposase [Streptococcus pneumoniae]|uniref:transposase n=1 Tax=Streptococcus pneumoniae TaxID=1313 RepID=UPI0005E29261|nr:transposase [Streptococcus pneumoniae]CJO42874.1 transposase [Streptococcus pneumoniae]
MEQLHFITKLLDIKDTNIQIIDVVNRDSHKEIIAKLDYDAPSCPECGNQLKKYDFQKPSKIPYLETTGMPTRILLRKRRFKCYHCSSRAMSRVRVQIMNQFHRKSHEYKAIKRYWKLIQQDSRKLSDKRFYRPTFRMHLTNKEILDKILSYSEDLKHHYQIYQLLLFHFQNKDPEKFFGLIEDNLKQVHPIFQTVFKTFLKNKEKIVNALQLPYSNAKLEATNNLIKLIKRNAFGFRNFENFKKRIFIALNIKKERTKFVLSQA